MLAVETQQEALVLRSAGYGLSTICERLGIGATAAKALFAKHGIKKGDSKREAVALARKRLLGDPSLQDDLRCKIAASVECDLSTSRRIREAALLQLDELTSPECTLPIHTKARALAAISTSISLSQQVMRRALGADRFENQVQSESLPKLEVVFMSREDEQAIRDSRETEDFFKAPSIDIDESLDVVEESY